MKKTVVSVLLALLLAGMVCSISKVVPAEELGIIHINTDGSITPSTANITTSDDVTYTFTGDNYLPIVVNRSNVVVNGRGYMLQASGNASGLLLSGVSNVTVKDTSIINSRYGIYLASSSGDVLFGNNVTNSCYGITFMLDSDNNTVIENNIINNSYNGVTLLYSSNNRFYHNNFNNDNQVLTYRSTNFWDDGYPSGGNYWRDYSGGDQKSGPNQNVTGTDGIGDAPYFIDNNNTDHYPLMRAYSSSPNAKALPCRSVAGEGCQVKINVTVINDGNYSGNFNLTVLANQTVIDTCSNVTILGFSTFIMCIIWNTNSFAHGSYAINAYFLSTSYGAKMVNFNCAGGTVKLTVLGDCNGDGKVNVLDLISIAGYLGHRATDYTAYSPGWCAFNNCDLNGDGAINQLDLITCACHMG